VKGDWERWEKVGGGSEGVGGGEGRLSGVGRRWKQVEKGGRGGFGSEEMGGGGRGRRR
jgi:hypothetical protein